MSRLATRFGLVAVLGLMMGTGQAQAQVTINLTVGNTGTGGLSPLDPGPFATVTLTQSGSNVLVDVKADNITTTGLGTTTPASISDFGFNLTGSATVDTTTIATTGVVKGSGTFTLASNKSFSGFGKFVQDVQGGPNNNRVQEITFTVDNATLGSFRSDAKGFAFAVHWYSNVSKTQHQLTGFASVPEPSPAVGVGFLVLVGLGWAGVRRVRHRSPQPSAV
jgi:hypothetical protein